METWSPAPAKGMVEGAKRCKMMQKKIISATNGAKRIKGARLLLVDCYLGLESAEDHDGPGGGGKSPP